MQLKNYILGIRMSPSRRTTTTAGCSRAFVQNILPFNYLLILINQKCRSYAVRLFMKSLQRIFVSEGSECTTNNAAVTKKSHETQDSRRRSIETADMSFQTTTVIRGKLCRGSKRNEPPRRRRHTQARRVKKISRIQASDDSTGIEDKHR